MKKIVFLLEEASLKEFLDIVLPKLLPPDVTFLTVPHEGKQDLEKSIPRKLRAWQEPDVRFVIMRDQDGSDCIRLKEKLCRLCAESGRPDSLVRIVCNELESWFLGDLAAVAEAFDMPSISRLQRKAKYRNPDNLTNAAQELKRIVSLYQKLKGARLIAEHIDIDRNRSTSFHTFIEGLLRVAGKT